VYPETIHAQRIANQIGSMFMDSLKFASHVNRDYANDHMMDAVGYTVHARLPQRYRGVDVPYVSVHERLKAAAQRTYFDLKLPERFDLNPKIKSLWELKGITPDYTIDVGIGPSFSAIRTLDSAYLMDFRDAQR
jgi:hypothetical protein